MSQKVAIDLVFARDLQQGDVVLQSPTASGEQPEFPAWIGLNHDATHGDFIIYTVVDSVSTSLDTDTSAWWTSVTYHNLSIPSGLVDSPPATVRLEPFRVVRIAVGNLERLLPS